MLIKENTNLFLLQLIAIGIGIYFPFSKYAVIEFFLILPIAIIFLISGILFFSITSEKYKEFKILASIFPLFIIAQIFSVVTVHSIQKFRSNLIIQDLQEIQINNGNFPDNYEVSFGIKYKLLNDKKSFSIKYSRGFLVTERYYSKENNWINMR